MKRFFFIAILIITGLFFNRCAGDKYFTGMPWENLSKPAPVFHYYDTHNDFIIIMSHQEKSQQLRQINQFINDLLIQYNISIDLHTLRQWVTISKAGKTYEFYGTEAANIREMVATQSPFLDELINNLN